MTENIQVRPYKPGDEQGIVRLFHEIFNREMTLDEWKWKYRGKGGNQKVYAVVGIDKTYGIIAHYGGIPHSMICRGKEILGLAIGDVMVHPKFRNLSLFKRIASLIPDLAVKDGFILGYGFPNERAMRLPEKLGLYEKIEDVIVAQKEVTFHNGLARYYYKLFPLDCYDDRIDRLWNSCKGDIHLGVIRDKSYFSWRYRNHPYLTYEVWGMRKRMGRQLQGIAVLRKEEHQAFIIDLVFKKGMLSPLLKKIENHLVSCAKSNVTLWAPPFLKSSLADSGFSTTAAGTCIPRTTHKKTLTKDQIQDRFFYTMGDTDFL